MNIFFQNSVDRQIAEFFLNHRSSFGIDFFSLVSSLGNWQFIFIAFVLIVLLLIINKKYLFIPPLISVVAGAELLVYGLKINFSRPRPTSAIISLADFSFPSGHATIAVTFYGFLLYFSLKFFKSWKKYFLVALFGSLIILIGLSRLYLGVHYFSDVLAGYLIGSAFLLAGIVFLENKFKNKILKQTK